MKKLIALMLVAAFVCFSATGCGDKDTKPTGSKPSNTGAAK